jgi:hypothetical protein
MFLVDGHLDLLEWNRDLTLPLADVRRREQGKTALLASCIHRSAWLAVGLAALIIVRNASAQEPAAPAAPVIVLGSGSGVSVQIGAKTYHGLLVRELLRQSLLLAGREELQLHVRDVTIGEATRTEANWELACSPGNPNLLEFLRGKAPSQVSVWQHPMQLPGDALKYDVLLSGMEKYSRSIFPKALKEQLPPEVFIKHAAGESGPFEIDSALLEEVYLVPQFAAVQKAQSVPPEQQFVPLRLETLIRGYANLGLLSECYWHPAHVGYKARALLYAQRWVAREPESARAVYCRAYAWMLAGINGLALADLEQAAKLADAKKEPPPSWAPLVQGACHYSLTKLSSYPSNQPHFKLARLLAAVTASRTNEPERAKTIAFLQRRETLAPRLFEGWYELDQEDNREDVWEMAAGHFGGSLYERLAAVPLLRESVKAIGKRNTEQPPPAGSPEELASRAALIAALFAPENDIPAAEPSPRALGELIQQATFLHAWGGGFDRDDDAIYTPLAECLKSHPYASLLKGRTAAKIKNVISQLDYDQLQYKERRLFYAFSQLDRDALALCFSAAERHRDLTTADYYPRLPWRHPQAAVKLPWQRSDLALARAVLEVDPHHPYARAVLIEGDWKGVEAQAGQWIATAAEHRQLAAALGQKLEQAGRLDDAEQLLVASLRTHDDLENYRDLALFYSAVGKRDLWQQTWDEYLQKNPEAPERWGILASLAENMIREHNLAAAETYGLEAARKGDVAGLLAAAAVYEIKESWEQAEQHYRRAAESSVTHEHEWYMFCRRVGQGDEPAAKKLAEGYFTEFVHRDRARRNFIGGTTRADLFDFHKGGAFGAALRKPLEALALFQDQFNRTPDPALGLHAAFMAVELKQPETRDRFIQRVVDDSPKYRSDDGDLSPLIVLGQEIQKDLKREGGKSKIDLEIARNYAKRMNGKRRTDFDYLLGRWYEICGEEALAKEAYLHCLGQPAIRHNSRTLAGIGLRRLGGGPADYRERFQAKEEEGEKEGKKEGEKEGERD